MKKTLFVFAVFFLVSCKGQKNNQMPDMLLKKFVDYYNQQQYDSVFMLFSANMQKSIPKQETVSFLSQLQKDAGTIEKYEFVSPKDGFARYKVRFTNDYLWVDIVPDIDGKIDGLGFKPYDGPGDKNAMPRNVTKMSLPFTGEWFVFWGGDSKEQNYHIENTAQKNAFDIIIMDAKGRSYKTDGKKNEDYYAFAQPLQAPCDAEVVNVTDGIADNIPGEMNPEQVTGNSVLLKTANNEFLLFAHFKQNSITVKKGDSIKRGNLLGLCGNSGNSSEPHLHFHIQDKEKMGLSTGIKCYFEKILVNGVVKTDYSPVKGERIKNAD